ncbi:MAG: GFA family protein, partial [Rhodothermales bacterium]|nr:GFA family protein [Rhodothermales bacterium]
LDDANGLTLEREIFIDRKPDSFQLAGDHVRLTEAETLAMYGVETGDS